MVSIRSIAGCIGVTGNISILGDFLGFLRARVPPDPTGVRINISLLQQVQRLQQPHFHLNIIRIGLESFTDAENIQIDYSIFKCRNIYAAIGVGVGRVSYFFVTVAEAGGLDAPTTVSQVEDISSRWVVDNDAIDVSIPFAMSVPSDGGQILGKSPVGGPCPGDKDDKGMNGSVVGLFGSEQTARSFSHEVGHYLGLDHQNGTPINLMAQTSFVMTAGLDVRNAVALTSSQGNTVSGHCMIAPPC